MLLFREVASLIDESVLLDIPASDWGPDEIAESQDLLGRIRTLARGVTA